MPETKTSHVTGDSLTARALTKQEAASTMILPRITTGSAQVAELADALDSGSSVRKDVEVRILSWAPTFLLKPPWNA